MRPPRWLIIAGKTAWQPWKTPSRLVAKTRRHESGGIVASKASSWLPALFTSTSRRWCRARISFTAACQDSGEVTSKATQKPRLEFSCASFSACSRRECTPSQTTLSGDSWRKLRAMAWPRPPFAPVMKMTRKLMANHTSEEATCLSRINNFCLLLVSNPTLEAGKIVARRIARRWLAGWSRRG